MDYMYLDVPNVPKIIYIITYIENSNIMHTNHNLLCIYYHNICKNNKVVKYGLNNFRDDRDEESLEKGHGMVVH